MDLIGQQKDTCPLIDDILSELVKADDLMAELHQGLDEDFDNFTSEALQSLRYAIREMESLRRANEAIRKWGHENGRACYDDGYESGYNDCEDRN